MPQIQYPAYTQPPAFTPPTAQHAPKMELPDNPQVFIPRRDYRLRGGGYNFERPGTTVFAVEQWALPKPQIASAYLPHNPQEFIARREYLTRGGGYRSLYEKPGTTVFAIEKWAVTMGWPEGPDAPQQFRGAADTRARIAAMPSFTRDIVQPTTAVTWGWDPSLPDLPTRRPSGLQTRSETLLPSAWPPVLLWSATYPDRVQTRRLPVAALPCVETDPYSLTVQPIVVTISAWVTYPDTTRRATLTTALIPTRETRGPALEQVAPTLQWSAKYHETTSRRRLSASAMPSSVTDPTTPAPFVVRAWNVTYPSTTSRRRLAPATLPVSVTDPTTPAVVLVTGWGVTAPVATRRPSLAPADYALTATRGAWIVRTPPILTIAMTVGLTREVAFTEAITQQTSATVSCTTTSAHAVTVTTSVPWTVTLHRQDE